MPGNNDPIFSRQGNTSKDGTSTSSSVMNQPITTAANDFTGAGANNVVVFTADATNGSYLARLRFKACGSGNNVATVARIFINNGGAATTAANNTFYGELPLPASTTNAAGQTAPDLDYPMNIALDPGFRVLVGLGTAPAGGGWVVTPVGGKY